MPGKTLGCCQLFMRAHLVLAHTASTTSACLVSCNCIACTLLALCLCFGVFCLWSGCGLAVSRLWHGCRAPMLVLACLLLAVVFGCVLGAFSSCVWLPPAFVLPAFWLSPDCCQVVLCMCPICSLAVCCLCAGSPHHNCLSGSALLKS